MESSNPNANKDKSEEMNYYFSFTSKMLYDEKKQICKTYLDKLNECVSKGKSEFDFGNLLKIHSSFNLKDCHQNEKNIKINGGLFEIEYNDNKIDPRTGCEIDEIFSSLPSSYLIKDHIHNKKICVLNQIYGKNEFFISVNNFKNHNI